MNHSYREDLRLVREATRIFEDAAQNPSSHRTAHKVYELICSERFLTAIFDPAIPAKSANGEKEEFSAMLVSMYDAASKSKCVFAINNAIGEFGYIHLTRTPCVFLASVVNLGMANMNSKATDLGQKLDHGEITNTQYQKTLDRLETFQNELWAMMDHVKGALKSNARQLARQSGLPKKIAYSALYTVPGPKYLGVYKLAYYLRALLNNIYGFVDATDTWDFDEVFWGRFFSGIYGKDKVIDVAASLLVEENVRDLSQYKKNPDAVAMCMNSLMDWAMSTLNRAPDDSRSHMVELCLKRLNALMEAGDIVLKFDLRDIDAAKFANLARTLKRYANKFATLLGET